MITTNMLYIAGTTAFIATEPTAIVTIWLCNQHSELKDMVTLHVLPAGQSANSSNCIYKSLEINPTDTYVIDNERIVLSAGDRLYAVSTGDAFTSCVVSAMEGL